MKRLLVFYIVLGCYVLVPAQFSTSAQVPDSIDARVGDLFQTHRYREALALLEPAAERAKTQHNWERYGDLTADIARALNAEERFAHALERIAQGVQTLQAAGMGESIITAKLLNWQAITFLKMQRYGETLAAYQKAIQCFEKNNYKGAQLAYAYKNAAQIYLRYSDNRQAIEYLEAALRSDTSRSQNASIFSQLSASFLFLDSVDAAQRYYALGMAEPVKRPSHLASLQSTGAELAFREQNWEKAKQLTSEALTYYLTDPVKGEQRIRSLTALADIASRQGAPNKARQYYFQADTTGKAIYPGKSREMAKLYVETGQFFEQNAQPDSALTYYQQALIQAFPHFDNPDPAENPAPADVPLESQAMRAAAAKAHLLLRKPNPSVQSRLNAAHCFDLSFAVAAQLRRTYGNDADKFALAANNRPAYTAAANNLWILSRQPGQSGALNRLFAFLEQTKAQALGDALQQQRALALSGIPDSLLKHEETLRRETAAALIELNEQEQEGDTSRQADSKDRWFRLQQAYTGFLNHLSAGYPLFRQYAESGLAAGLPAIRTTLPDSTALLSWFDAGDRYLCAVLRRTALSAFDVPRDSAFDAALAGFQTLLADKNRQETDPAAYFTAAYTLKQRLLPDSVLAGASTLIIVPDGRLSYLPFEALTTAPHRGAYGTAPYLLRSHAVQYAWSATLLSAGPASGPPGKGLLQVAPFVQSARDGLAPLPNSPREKPEQTPAAVLQGPAATADAFFRAAPAHAVLHLSTHAHAGQRAEPVIELADRAVSLPEIYAQRLHASLVSLSACETGAGAFAGGEGVLSLARAFAYAGARSLVASHWSVNERSTADLFAAFYRCLENGLPKSAALRQAKLQLLEQAGLDARKAPYYWAAFTLSGADGPVDMRTGWPWWVWVLGLGIIGIGVWGGRRYLRRRRTRSAP